MEKNTPDLLELIRRAWRLSAAINPTPAPAAACEWCAGAGHDHFGDPCDHCATTPDTAALVEALEEIVKQYPNPDISHVDYRVHACRHAEQALAAYRAQQDPAPRPSWLDGGAEAVAMAKEDDQHQQEVKP